MNLSHSANVHPAIEQAAHWFVELNDSDCDPKLKQKFESWLNCAENQLAWRKVLDLNHSFYQLQEYQKSNPDIVKTLQQPALSRRDVLKCAAIFGLSYLSYQMTQTPAALSQWTKFNAEYSAAIGESQQITLADSSRIWLNTNSAIDTAFTNRVREIQLLQGEVYVSTASDQRPLIVTSQWRDIPVELKALGTEFNVQKSDETIALSVYQGEVQFSASDKQLRLKAGQQVSLSNKGFSQLNSASKTPSWKQGKLIAENMSIAEFSQELARYRIGVIRVSPEVETMAIDGVFPVFDTDKALAMLEQTLPVRVQYLTPWWINISAE